MFILERGGEKWRDNELRAATTKKILLNSETNTTMVIQFYHSLVDGNNFSVRDVDIINVASVVVIISF